MRILLYISLIGSLLMGGCNQASDRVKAHDEHNSKRDERVLVSEQKNAKYGLSALFYKDPAHEGSNFDLQKDLPNVLVFRNDNTKQELRLVELSNGNVIHDVFHKVWSPDEEYLLLYCEGSSKLCIYKASEMLPRLSLENAFDTENAIDFVGPIVYTEEYPPDKGKKKQCGLRFEKWDGDNAFTFKVGTVESKGGRSKFRYDIDQKNIYSGLNGRGREQDLGNDYGFDAANKSGKLKFIKEKY